MIRRTLDTILSVAQEIGKNMGSESLLFTLASAARNTVLPVRVQHFIESDEGEVKSHDDLTFWNEYDYSSGQVKRTLAKAFEKRRRVKVGEKFTLEKQRYLDTGMGVTVPINYEVKRVGKSIVEVRGFWGRDKDNSNGESYVISDSKKDLGLYKDSAFVPVYYRGNEKNGKHNNKR